MVWVKFPVADCRAKRASKQYGCLRTARCKEFARAKAQSSSGRPRHGRSPATARSASRRRSSTASTGDGVTRRQLGASRRQFILADKLAEQRDEGGEGREPSRRVGDVAARHVSARHVCPSARDAARLRLSGSTPRRRSRHGRGRHGLRAHGARPRPRGLRHLDGERAEAAKRAASTPTIPFTVDGDGRFTKEAPGFEGKRVIDDKGNKGDANDAVIKALVEADALIARGRLKHQYPHSWRSKKPVIFRNTPQWFIAMDKPLARRPPSPSPFAGRGTG